MHILEIRWSVRLLCQTHQAFTDAKAVFRRGGYLRQTAMSRKWLHGCTRPYIPRYRTELDV